MPLHAQVFGFQLEDTDMAAMSTLHDGRHVSWDPTHVEWACWCVYLICISNLSVTAASDHVCALYVLGKMLLPRKPFHFRDTSNSRATVSSALPVSEQEKTLTQMRTCGWAQACTWEILDILITLIVFSLLFTGLWVHSGRRGHGEHRSITRR